MAEIHVGTSGWSYDHWSGVFYPDELKPADWLSFYCGQFATVEINNTFYRTPSGNAVENWVGKTPEGFVFSVKAHRFLTHVRRLGVERASLEKLYTLADQFKGKARCLLFQLPPYFVRTPEHHDRVKKFAGMLDTRYDHAFEFRHPSWWEADMQDLFGGRAAFCAVDGLSMPNGFPISSEHFYMRFHGPDLYSDEYLEQAAERILKVVREQNLKRVYIYFDNDTSGFAVKNALTLRNLLPPR